MNQEIRERPIVVPALAGMDETAEELPANVSQEVRGIFPWNRERRRLFGKVRKNYLNGQTILALAGSRAESSLTFNEFLVQTDTKLYAGSFSDVYGTAPTLVTTFATATQRGELFHLGPMHLGFFARNATVQPQLITTDDLAPTIVAAEIPASTVACSPVFSSGSTSPTNVAATVAFPNNKIWAYQYVYASSQYGPYVADGNSIGGQLFPRGNPHPDVEVISNTTSNTHAVFVSCTAPSRADLDEIWIFRSLYYDTTATAELANAVDAGLMYYVGRINSARAMHNAAGESIGNSSVDWQFHDKTSTEGVDQIELDNYGAPNLAYAAFYWPYIFGLTSDGVLHRCKANNPFSWGRTKVVGDLRSAEIWAHQTGSSVGTAIACIPNEPILKVDGQLPTKSYSFNLSTANNYDSFIRSQRVVSDVHSVTCQWSQFTAVTEGQPVLWGMDYSHFAMLQSNGLSQTPIAKNLQAVLRSLSTAATTQLKTHGVYDPLTQLNCLWVQTSASSVLMIYQHVPTGFWGILEDRDITCVAPIFNAATGQTEIWGGTSQGYYGRILAPTTFGNWLPDTGATYQGTATGGSSTTIVCSGGFGSGTLGSGVDHNWVLLTDADGKNEQWRRIISNTNTTLTVATLSPACAAGFKFYIGLIECSVKKIFDFQTPTTDKGLDEIALTQKSADSATSTLLRLYKDRNTDYDKQTIPFQVGSTDTWFARKDLPSDVRRTLTLEIINRGYAAWTLYNHSLKVKPVP